jgi:hypothetical protein
MRLDNKLEIEFLELILLYLDNAKKYFLVE